MSVDETRDKLADFPPDRHYTAELHRTNVACIALPTVIIAAAFAMMQFLGIVELAWTAALLSVLAVVLSPIAALVTMPWRGVYENAPAYGVAWRLVLLAAPWAVLLAIGVWALLAGSS